MADLRDTLNTFARRFVQALQASTRLRAVGDLALKEAPSSELQRASTAHVPGAGWLVGITACLTLAVASVLLRGNPFAPLVAAVASTAATVALTGGLHEAALFRYADAPARGGQAVLALVLVLAGKLVLVAALAAASEAGVIASLFAAHVVSRFALVVAEWAARADHDVRDLRVGALWCVVPLLLLLAAGGLPLLLLPLLIGGLAFVAALRFSRPRPGLPTAERPHVAQQVAELGFYLGAAIAA